MQLAHKQHLRREGGKEDAPVVLLLHSCQFDIDQGLFFGRQAFSPSLSFVEGVREGGMERGREGGKGDVPVVLLLHARELNIDQRLFLGRQALLYVFLHPPEEVGTDGGLEGGEGGLVFQVPIGGLKARKIGKHLGREGAREGGKGEKGLISSF